MKTLTKLAAECVEAPWIETVGNRSGVHDEPAKGFHRVVTLGNAGLLIRTGLGEVGIPMAELIRLAEAAEPLVAPPAAATILSSGERTEGRASNQTTDSTAPVGH